MNQLEYIEKQKRNPVASVGSVFGNWTVRGLPFKVAISTRKGSKKGYRSKAYVVCQCSCGELHAVNLESIQQGLSTKCMTCKPNSTTKHGKCGSPIYSVWNNIMAKAKCNDHPPKWRCYNHVDVDPRWLDFRAFYEDVGDVPEGKTIDRIDNLRGYWPDNVRWATHKEQAQNRRTHGTLAPDMSK